MLFVFCCATQTSGTAWGYVIFSENQLPNGVFKPVGKCRSLTWLVSTASCTRIYLVHYFSFYNITFWFSNFLFCWLFTLMICHRRFEAAMAECLKTKVGDRRCSSQWLRLRLWWSDWFFLPILWFLGFLPVQEFSFFTECQVNHSIDQEIRDTFPAIWAERKNECNVHCVERRDKAVELTSLGNVLTFKIFKLSLHITHLG